MDDVRERSAHIPHCRAMQWIEALINVTAFVGFVGMANLGGKTCRQREPEEPIALS
jgi:hypothetical protein